MSYFPTIVNNPGAVLENLIQAVADQPDLTLRPFADGQTSSVFRLQDHAGVNTLFQLRAGGEVARVSKWDAAAAAIFTCFDGANSNVSFSVFPNGRGAGVGIVEVSCTFDSDVGYQFFGNSGTQTGNALEIYPDGGTLGFSLTPAGTGVNAVLDTTTGTKWGTAASQKQGWYGTTPVIQQANASAAGVSGIAGAVYATDAAAIKAALTAIRAGLAACGILAATA